MPTDLSVVDEEEEEGSSSEEEEEVGGALESWSSWLWRGSMGLIKRMTSKR